MQVFGTVFAFEVKETAANRECFDETVSHEKMWIHKHGKFSWKHMRQEDSLE